MAGRAYEAGGIRRTVRLTRDASDDAAAGQRDGGSSPRHARRAPRRSRSSRGYGLTVDDEARALRLAATLTPETTYLGAHVVPDGSSREEYVDLVCGEMLDACAPHARWIDVFCETGAFTVDESRRILEAGAAAGLGAAHARRPARPRARRDRPRASSSVPHRIDHCTYPDRRRRLRARQLVDGRHPPAGRRASRPGTRIRMLAASWMPGSPSRSPAIATRARATRRRWRSASPSPCATWA